MKSSIFKKVALWLLIIITAVEVVMFAALYTYTYNKAVAEATADITKAAKDAAELVTFTDPDKYDIESTDEQIITSVLTNACNQYEVDIIYFLLPNLRDNTVMYLTRGTSALQGSKEDSHPVNDLTGHYVEGGLTDEMKRAFEGDESGIVVHITNKNEDKLACYMPVWYYGDSENGKAGAKIKSIVSAEISLQNVTSDFKKKFREFAVIMVIVTLTVGISAAVILYFRVSKPLKKISMRMKGFVELEQYIDDVAELNRQKAELNIAQTIQLGLLEPDSFENDKVKINASMTTARVVGGDLYDYRILDNGSVFVAIGDVSGKGITAALFMARAITLLNNYAKLGYSPAKMLFEFNNNLAAHNPNMMFITAFVAVYDPKAGELIYSNAGHNYPYIISDKLTALNTENGIMAGSFEDVEFPEYTVKMKPGDCLFMYTDGVTEAANKSGELFGETQLEEVLHKNKDCADNLLNAVTAEINGFAQGSEQSDDMTMLTLQIKPD